MKKQGLLKAAKIVGIVLGALVAVLLVFTFIQPLLYAPYYAQARQEFATVGLEHGLVPQGFTYVEDEGVFVQAGYMTDGKSPSRLYVIAEDGSFRAIELYAPDGTAYTGHTGGVTVGEKWVWLANDGEGEDNCVWVIPRADVMDENTRKITLSERFFPECRAAFCTVNDGYLWVGEFYGITNYPTKGFHHLTFDDGSENAAFACAYPLDESSPTGLASDTPDRILSIGDRVQGMAFSESGRIALSSSYSLLSSHLYLYDDVFKREADTAVSVNGKDVPVWCLDEAAATESLTLPPMTEELAVKDERMYVLFESACHKYIFGIFTRGLWVYSIPFA